MTLPQPTKFHFDEPAVACQIMDGEAIVIHFDRGDYFSVKGSGAFLLGLLERGRGSSELASALSQRFGVELESASRVVSSFLAQLLEEGLVVESAGDASTAASFSASPGSEVETARELEFEPPLLVKYTDLQDLLVLDPIHDVILTGWPPAHHERWRTG